MPILYQERQPLRLSRGTRALVHKAEALGLDTAPYLQIAEQSLQEIGRKKICANKALRPLRLAIHLAERMKYPKIHK